MLLLFLTKLSLLLSDAPRLFELRDAPGHFLDTLQVLLFSPLEVLNLSIQPIFLLDLQLGLSFRKLPRLRRFHKARFDFDDSLQQILFGVPGVLRVGNQFLLFLIKLLNLRLTVM